MNLPLETSNFLVGAFDEADPVDFSVLSRVGHYKKEKVNSLKLFQSDTDGTLQGESAAFFMVGKKPTEKSWAKVEDVQIIYFPSDANELIEATSQFLKENEVSAHDLDLIVQGQSGDPKKDELSLIMIKSLFDKTPQARFKHLSGEYCTSTSFAWWLSSMILKNQFVPDVVRANGIMPVTLKTILILNHYQGKNYSLSLFRLI
jgi:hypothetical protein